MPSLNMGYNCKTGDVGRFQRCQERKKQQHRNMADAESEAEGDTDMLHADETEGFQDSSKASTDAGTQTDVPATYIEMLENEVQQLRTENLSLRQKIHSCSLSENFFKKGDGSDDDVKVKYYTGLPSLLILTALVNFLSPHISSRPRTVTSKFQEIVMVLMRLRLNLPVQVIADMLHVSQSTASRVFLKIIDVMYVHMKPIIHWPDRESLRRTMPAEFRQYFGKKVTVIIDCFELFIETPSSLLARAQTFSAYKHHNTIKYLIGIAQQGVVSFISCGWGGRTSDKWITENSTFLDNLLPGDLVLADRGFNIHESVGLMCAEVRIPAFTKGRKQLSAFDVESTRKIAHVRIHVERVIGNIIQKYPILDSTIPITMLCCAEGEQVTTLDKMVTVCCALVNICPSVVPFE